MEELWLFIDLKMKKIAWFFKWLNKALFSKKQYFH